MSTRALLLLVGLIGGAELLVRGHLADSALAFHAGAWLLAVSLVVATRGRAAWLRYGAAALAAVCALLSLAELLPGRPASPTQASPLFDVAGGDPEAMRLWWEERAEARKILRGETQLVPGQRFSLFESEIELDELGLRRAEPPREGAWRIVVVGNSATFGATQNGDDRPWPDLLEREIATAYACERPVDVRNAGLPGRTLQSVGGGYDAQIAPLAPDLIVVYPGIDALDGLLPKDDGLKATESDARASRWLAALERPLRERIEARRLRAAEEIAPDPELLRRSPAARGYRSLLVAARAHGVDVALVPIALAVDADSPARAIRFHEAVWPETRWLVVANHNHARLLPLLGVAYRAEVLDPPADLDGAWQDGFVDLFDFTQTGSERLAHHVATALAPILARGAGCKPR
ncbi:MAG TPA: SGNH/GDSL hydrolase family protein [Myxococcota bacterium]|nr:SGNH/GDSL hydrolase family protein [Myxococcota bacterium]